MLLPGDALVADPAIQTTEAVYIDAPVAAVWPWLVQMGQDRGGFYGCEGLKNWPASTITMPTGSTRNGNNSRWGM